MSMQSSRERIFALGQSYGKSPATESQVRAFELELAREHERLRNIREHSWLSSTESMMKMLEGIDELPHINTLFLELPGNNAFECEECRNALEQRKQYQEIKANMTPSPELLKSVQSEVASNYPDCTR